MLMTRDERDARNPVSVGMLLKMCIQTTSENRRDLYRGHILPKPSPFIALSFPLNVETDSLPWASESTICSFL